jgi:choline kinase
MMRTPEGVLNWYLKAINAIAPSGEVGTVSIEGMDWAEVDFPADLEIARALTDGWAASGWADQPAEPGQAAFSQSRTASRSAGASA